MKPREPVLYVWRPPSGAKRLPSSRGALRHESTGGKLAVVQILPASSTVASALGLNEKVFNFTSGKQRGISLEYKATVPKVM